MPLNNGEIAVRANGVKHWVRVAGAEHRTTPLFIVHGGPGGNLYNFERTAGQLLESSTTVVYCEQRGCGRSDAPEVADAYSMELLVSDLDGVRQMLGIDRCSLLGFSFGCEVALEFALALPQRVERIILQCPSVGDPRRIGLAQLCGLERVARPAIRQRLQKLLKEDGPIESMVERAWSLADSETVDRLLFVSHEHAKRNRQMWRESGLQNTGEMARALKRRPDSEPPLYRRIETLQRPTLVMVGLHDRNVGVDVARDVSDAIPGSRFEIFAESAHFPDIEETPRYASTVRAFLEEGRQGPDGGDMQCERVRIGP